MSGTRLINAASQQADVPFSAVRTRVNGGLSVESHVGRAKALSAAVQNDLVKYVTVVDMADRGFGKNVN